MRKNPWKECEFPARQIRRLMRTRLCAQCQFVDRAEAPPLVCAAKVYSMLPLTVAIVGKPA